MSMNVAYIEGPKVVFKQKRATRQSYNSSDSEVDRPVFENQTATEMHLEKLVGVLKYVRQEYFGTRTPKYLS